MTRLLAIPLFGPKGTAACGLLFNWRAAWIGVHYSSAYRRTCVNLLPFFTLGMSSTGGMRRE